MAINLLAKADQLLAILAERGESTVPELVELTNEPRTSIYRLLESLQDLGWVSPGSARGSYSLGMRMFELGAAAPVAQDLRQAALPILQGLNRATGDTVFLCVRDGLSAVCIERLDGAAVNTLALKLGGTLPLHVGAGPRALLSADPDGWDDYLFRAPLRQMTERTPDSVERVRVQLEADRRADIVLSQGDVTNGIGAIGARVRDHTGTVVASVSISGIEAVLLGPDRAAKETMVLDTADRISEALGWRRTSQSLPAVSGNA